MQQQLQQPDRKQDILKAVSHGIRPAADKADNAEFPSGPDFLFYKHFGAFTRRIAAAQERILQSLSMFQGASSEKPEDAEEVHESLQDILDKQLDEVDVCLDRHRKQQSGAPGTAAPRPASPPRQGKVSWHIASITRPQDSFDVRPDNSNTPFVLLPPVVSSPSVALPAELPEEDQEQFGRHPLAAQLLALEYLPSQLQAGEARLPVCIGDPDAISARVHWVDTPEALEAMVRELQGERELAVDLEHHSYRSFMGFTCLIQMSTRSNDYLVDALALRSHIRSALGPLFQDAGVVKVFHGADSDMIWLQRDFGVYVVNLFDTGQAARELEFPSYGLKYLLQHVCGVSTDKRYQMADWRQRPLSEEMKKYAAMDTHFLLYAHDRLKYMLGQLGEGAVLRVLHRSRSVALKTFQKDLLLDTSYLHWIRNNVKIEFSDEERAVVAALFNWRDRTARELDESTSYVMSKAVLVAVSRSAPRDRQHLARVCKGAAPVALRRSDEVLEVIRTAHLPPTEAGAAAALPAPASPARSAEADGSSGNAGEAAVSASGKGALLATMRGMAQERLQAKVPAHLLSKKEQAAKEQAAKEQAAKEQAARKKRIVVKKAGAGMMSGNNNKRSRLF